MESSSGRVLRRYPIPTGFARAVYFSPPATLYIAGMLYSDPALKRAKANRRDQGEAWHGKDTGPGAAIVPPPAS